MKKLLAEIKIDAPPLKSGRVNREIEENQMSQKYTVISTSGYQTDNWHYQAQFDKRADAVAL